VNTLWEFIGAIFISLGGLAALITFAMKFGAKIIENRLSAQYELELSKKLEEYKNQLEGSQYISRAMFDKEYVIYQDLSKQLYEAFPCLELINGIKKSGKEVIYREDLNVDNPNLEMLLNKFVGNEAFTEIQIDKLRSEASESMLKFSKMLGESGAFIPHRIQRLFADIYDTIYYYLNGKNGVFADWNDVLISIGKMQSELREYLNSLVVLDRRA